jgi:hypothetical protein
MSHGRVWPATMFFKRVSGTWRYLSAGTAYPEDSLRELGVPLRDVKIKNHPTRNAMHDSHKVAKSPRPETFAPLRLCVKQRDVLFFASPLLLIAYCA